MKTATNRTLFPIPAFSAAFQRGLLLATIIPPRPNVPAFIPSSRSCLQFMENLYGFKIAHWDHGPVRSSAFRRPRKRGTPNRRFMESDNVGGGMPPGRDRPDEGGSHHKPGRAELPLGQAARQRRPTWFKALRHVFEIMEAHREPDRKPKEDPARKPNSQNQNPNHEK